MSLSSIHSQYTMHGEILESVDCACYLGASISKDLTWPDTYIKRILTKANRTLGFVKNVRTKNESVKELAYKFFFGLNSNMTPPYGALTLTKYRNN